MSGERKQPEPKFDISLFYFLLTYDKGEDTPIHVLHDAIYQYDKEFRKRYAVKKTLAIEAYHEYWKEKNKSTPLKYFFDIPYSDQLRVRKFWIPIPEPNVEITVCDECNGDGVLEEECYNCGHFYEVTCEKCEGKGEIVRVIDEQ